MKRHLWSLLVALLFTSQSSAIELDLAVDKADWTAWGGYAQDNSSNVVIADLNGDGVPDLAFGQNGWDDPTNAADVGRVCIYFGPVSFPDEHDLLTEGPPTCIVGDTLEARIGGKLSVGDLDGDGIPDLLVGAATDGAFGTEPEAHSVAVFLGRRNWPRTVRSSDAAWTVHGAESRDAASFASVADLNGDNAPDLVLFAPNADGPGNSRRDAGEAYIFFGPTSAWTKTVVDLATDTPDVHIFGADGGDDNPLGSSADTLGFRFVAGDIIGDSTADLVVGARGGAGPSNTTGNAGEIYVFAGRSSWPPTIDLRTVLPDLLVYGPASSSALDSAAIGDWDADGEVDLILGASGHSAVRQFSGAVFVLRGRSGLVGVRDLATQPADATILGPRTLMGRDVRTGDVNGDSYVDIVAASIGDKTPYIRDLAGSVLVVAGCDGYEALRDLATAPPELSSYGEEKDKWGGTLRVGDIDGDGKADIFAGAHSADSVGNSRSSAGEVHVFRGRAFSASVCTITPDPGSPARICGTATDMTLDGSSSIVTNCSVTPQYRWMDGTTELRGWDIDPTFVVRPTATTAYRLEVRCGDCAGPCFETAMVLVTVDPDVTPPSLGNTVLAFRSGADVELSWGSVSEARTYSLYRGTQKDTWPPAPISSSTATAETLPDVPGPPNLYFYRISGASCSGMEGP